jgi:negative regulator of flagellin synthesis FlgM
MTANIADVTGKYEQTTFLNETTDKMRVDTPAISPEETKTKTEPIPDDKVSISDASRDMKTAKEAVASTPDVRQEKVDAIKQAVENGKYEIDESKVAEKMIGSFVDETL